MGQVGESWNYSIEEGIEKGIQQGKNDYMREIAKSMKSKGLDPNLIAECTGMTLKDIEELNF